MKVKSLTDLPSIAQYLHRIGAEPRSLRVAVVRETSGKYWRDIAQIRIEKDGTVRAPEHFEPTEGEAALIKAEATAADWPNMIKLGQNYELPEKLKFVDPETIFEFRDIDGSLIMLQQRMADRKGGKVYVPWTFWDDSEWRIMEPEGKLPLWGMDQLSEHSTVFAHEGAKAARACYRLVNPKDDEGKLALKQHPWGEELAAAAHLGWIGGALSPARTDWTPLIKAGVKRVYIVSDNDEPGLAAVPAIAFQVPLLTFHVQFTSEWPVSFDLADNFPDNMFKVIGDTRHYIGPSMRSCTHPATWATDLIANKKGKPTTVLRESFKNMFAYVEEADAFVCKEMPEILRTDIILNRILAPFSHVQNTAGLITKSYRGRTTKLCYRPDIKGRIVTDRTTSAINLHVPTLVKSVPGDITPWMDFMKYLIPDEIERYNTLKWCATLIAKPNVRMEYALLLVSEMQGIGKTTLGAKILGPLVGEMNVGYPSEEDIVNSPFNSWVANKRLIIIGEIYSGHSWKAYNRLKGYITDKDIEANHKYMRPYRVENWVHVVACSNSRKALRMEEQDRRWFYPTLCEEPWPREKFGILNEWLQGGGLQIIRAWAERFGDYVQPGDRAPSTLAKLVMMSESRSEAQSELSDLCEAVTLEKGSVAMAMKEVTNWLKRGSNGKFFDSPYELRKVAEAIGWSTFPRRLKVGSQMQYIILSPKARENYAQFNQVVARSEFEQNNFIRAILKTPESLSQADM